MYNQLPTPTSTFFKIKVLIYKIVGMVNILFYYATFQTYSLAIDLLWTPKFTKKIGVLLGYVYVEDRKRVYIKYLTVTYLTSLSLEVNKIGKKKLGFGCSTIAIAIKGFYTKNHHTPYLHANWESFPIQSFDSLWSN